MNSENSVSSCVFLLGFSNANKLLSPHRSKIDSGERKLIRPFILSFSLKKSAVAKRGNRAEFLFLKFIQQTLVI